MFLILTPISRIAPKVLKIAPKDPKNVEDFPNGTEFIKKVGLYFKKKQTW